MSNLADIAKIEAAKCFHGFVMKTEPNFQKITCLFPNFTNEEADGMWCAAFVYYCCSKAGFDIPIQPIGCSYNLAACGAWEHWAIADERIEYYSGNDKSFVPKQGDIVLYDRVFEDKEHDHIGIVVEVEESTITAAEGNINNLSGIIKRKREEHIRAYIRLPEKFSYYAEAYSLGSQSATTAKV